VCDVAKEEDDVAKGRGATKARGVAKRRAAPKDHEVASGGTSSGDEAIRGEEVANADTTPGNDVTKDGETGEAATDEATQRNEAAESDDHVEAVKADLTQVDEVIITQVDEVIAQLDEAIGGVEVTEVRPDTTQGNKVPEVPAYFQPGIVQLDAATTAAKSCATVLKAIVAETTDYSKKLIDSRLAFVEKLLGAKSLDTVIQVQSEYAKTYYNLHVAEAKKLRELYSDLAKVAFKPFDVAITNTQGTNQ
jgi:DNA-binding NtrC family response regulator